MGEAIGQVLPLGIGVSLSPLPIIAVMLILGTPRARSNSQSFLMGWFVGLAIVGAAVLLLVGGADASTDGEPATWVSWVKLILGLLLVLMTTRSWRRRARAGDEPAMPAWMLALDTFTARKSLGMAALLSGVNPKNLMLTTSAVVTIAQTGIASGQQILALAVFAVIGSLGIAVPVAVYFLGGSRAEHTLSDWKTWMAQHHAAIMTAVLLLLGTKLLGDAVAGLAAE